MTIRFLGTFAVLALLSSSFGLAQAAENTPVPTAEKTVEAPVKPATDELTPNEQAKQDALTEKMVALTKKLDLKQIQHFTVIYANYMVLSMVNAVEKDVGNAVTGCGKNNPGLSGEMNERFEKWKTTLEQPRKDSEANINSMILAQDYISKAEIDELFALVDETRQKNSSEFEKVPVTTPEACKYMLSKMDETEKSMTQLLTSTLASYPSMLQKTQQ